MRLRAQRALRAYLRRELATWPPDVPVEEWMEDEMVAPAARHADRLTALLERLRAMGELFVGMANGPFLLVLRASEPERFIAYADEHPTHNVHITFDAAQNLDVRDQNLGVQASLRPAGDPEAYTLFFGLPRVLREYLLFDEDRGIRLAPGLKRKFFSEITVYRRVDNRDVLYRLTYEPQAIRRLPAGV